ncbi:DUF3093 domain-containing protein [Pseudonocardia sp. NPDC049154]|uniref:DUF3093 domain-containing protein n=1 Tax=Pseudonocardia sp. NPDC049154 TaxID=3155501 RepID=UPI0033D35235
MSEHPSCAGPATSGRPGFDERLSTPLWWFLFAGGVAVLLGAEIHMGYPGVRSWIGYVVLIPLALLVVWRLGSVRVRVTDTELIAGDERIALEHVGRTQIVSKKDKQQALGPELDPIAHVLHRSWIGPVVRIETRDPASPVPYWVVSSRRPEELVAALSAARA